VPTRVLFLHCSDGGYGADRQLLHLVTGLDRRRYEPLVALPAHGTLSEKLAEAGVRIVRVDPLAALRRDLLTPSALADTSRRLTADRRALVRIVRDEGVRIVHTNSSIVIAGQAVADDAGAAHVMHVREVWPGSDRRLERAVWPLLRRRILRADSVLCVSAAAARAFRGARHVRVVHDGVAVPARLPGRDEARRALGLRDDAFVAVAVARLSDWKGQDVLLRSLVRPELASLDAVAVVAGDAAPGQDRFRRDLVRLAAGLGLNGRLRMLGHRDDVDVIRAAADAEVVPSRRPDALPNSALEAAAAGLPLVGADAGGQPEIVRDGVTGRLVAPGDPAALAGALSEIAADPEAARSQARAAAREVARRFAVSRMVEEVQACYDEL
jgi:glycosyltransferase involved in cell wall biosynthesis